ncbi:MAG: sugar ABC transporter permease [Turicibacter sp.]|nr:sugar ABC transporter permease [Turicibacter sp.]
MSTVKISGDTNIKGNKKFKFDTRKYAMFIALIVIALLFQILTNGVLLKPMNVTKLILQNSYILVLAVGMLPCILTGNVDLSVGSIVALVSAISGVLIISMGLPVWVGIIIGLVVGALLGAWQGFWIAYVKVPAFIVTLAGMLIFRGLTMIILNGNTLSPFPASFQYIAMGFLGDIGNGSIHILTLIIGAIISVCFVVLEYRKRNQQAKYGIEQLSNNIFIGKILATVLVIMLFSYWLAIYKGIPFVFIILGSLIVLYSFVTNKMVIGRHVYALGGNEKATKLSGIKTKKVMFMVYVNMGIMAALAGLLFAARLNASTPGAGEGFELDAIAACYIGGASATGGVGTIIGAIIGGLVMGVLNNGMSLMGVGSDWQQTIKGLVLLAAVAFDIYNQSKK